VDEPVAGQPAPEASASAPAPAAFDIDKFKADLKAELQKDMDGRVGGFQTVINRLTEENNQLKRAQLPDDERMELDDQDRQDRIADLERQIALMQLAQQYPEIAPAYQQLLDAETPEDQVAILASLRAASQPASPEAEDQVAEVDRNNPVQTIGEIVGKLPNGAGLTGDIADEILKRFGKTATSELTG
jgi:hypothetical protein